MNNIDCDYITLRVPKEYFDNLLNIYQTWSGLCDRQVKLEYRLDEGNPEHLSIMSSNENNLARHRRLFEAASRLCMEFAVISHDCEATLHEMACNVSTNNVKLGESDA